MPSKLTKTTIALRCLYSLIVLASIIFIPFYLLMTANLRALFANWEVQFIYSTYFIFVIFCGFMQGLLWQYYPRKILQLLQLIFLPYLLAGIQYWLAPFSIPLYFVNAGIMHGTTIILAFTALIVAGPWLASNNQYRKNKMVLLKYYAKYVGAEALFIIPGLGAMYLFTAATLEYSVISGQFTQLQLAVYIASYALSIVPTTWLLLKQLQNESIVV